MRITITSMSGHFVYSHSFLKFQRAVDSRFATWIGGGMGIVLMLFWSSGALAEGVLHKDALLKHWGLSNSREIGYISVGILHDPGGDKLIVYDIRRKKPVFPKLSVPMGRTPDFDDDILLVSHFDHGNVNRLGGYFNGFFRRPSTSSVIVSEAPDGTPALTFKYSNHLSGFSGFWIHLFDFRVPPHKRVFLDSTPFQYLTFAVSGGHGGESLHLKVADRAWEGKEDSLSIGSLNEFLPEGKLTQGWQRAWVPLSRLPQRIDRRELASLVLQMEGEGEGEVYIKDLAFATRRDVSIPAARARSSSRKTLHKAMWLWETEKLLRDPRRQDDLVRFCRAEKITTLFVQIQYQASRVGGRWRVTWDSGAFRPFLARLKAAGIKIHALDGDPRFALADWHGRVLALIESVIRYNQNSSRAERFDGIRYDNEPYLLPQFHGIEKESTLRQYLDLLRKATALAHEGDLELGADIPFWFDSRNEFFEPTAHFGGRPVSEHVLDIVDNVGIMAYRTQAYGADGVLTHSLDELRYAARKGKKVYVGLETVQLPDETIYEFEARGRGTKLWIEDIGNGAIRIHLLPEGSRPEAGLDLLLYQTRRIPVPADKVTFHRKSKAQFNEVVRQIQKEFSTFPSLEGIAIHSYESYRPWLAGAK